jgi:phage baseplate assembly protein W|tara:strand:+ start:158 stop:565 length:408 start_codon:yes stop_codon:yes gene_type:complete
MSIRVDAKDRFIDFDLKFTKTGDAPHGLAVKKDINSIRQSLVNLILTRPGEKGFSPEFGTNVVDLLFENFSPVQMIRIQEDMRDAIQQFEPRVNFIGLDFDTSNLDSNMVSINVQFKLVNEQTLREITVELERGI